MATSINHDTVQFMRESLEKHGFNHALGRCSVDCIASGMDADDFTYQLVALFSSHILGEAMKSHTKPEDKFRSLQGNSKAMIQVVKTVTLELAKVLDLQVENEAKVAAEVAKNLTNPELLN